MFMLDYVLRDHTAREAVAAANERVEPKARRWITRQLRSCDGNPELVPWSEKPANAAALASVMEKAFQKHEEWADRLDWYTLFHAAMMIRIKAGGEAIIGKPLEWRPMLVGNGWTTGDRGPMWDIYPNGLPTTSWDIFIARWDKPDWSHNNEREAILVAEHIASWPPPELEN
jgi:hypothetical protein